MNPPTDFSNSDLPRFQVHQREAQALARGLAIGPLGEDVAELRIRELVDGPLQATAEVAPAITSGFNRVFQGHKNAAMFENLQLFTPHFQKNLRRIHQRNASSL